MTSVLSLTRDGEAESLRVEQRAETGDKWAYSGVVEYKVTTSRDSSLLLPV